MFIRSQVQLSGGAGLWKWCGLLAIALLGTSVQAQQSCTTCEAGVSCKECCPKPYKHWYEGPVRIHYKRGCPRPVADPCRLPHYGYYPTCWHKWPWPPEWSHCQVPTPGAMVPPSTGRPLPTPAYNEDNNDNNNNDNGAGGAIEEPLSRLPEPVNRSAKVMPLTKSLINGQPKTPVKQRSAVKTSTPPKNLVMKQDSVSILKKPTSKPEEPSTKQGSTPEKKISQVAAQLKLRYINDRRIILECSRDELGPIIPGKTQVDLWFTADALKWKRTQTITHKGPPYEVRVSRDGLYGFTLLAHPITEEKSGPKPGDAPQIWVEVDTTKPTVQLLSAQPSASGQGSVLNVSWRASDLHLSEKPVSLYWATSSAGPWSKIAENMSNTGSMTWAVPAQMPPQVVIKVEAEDRAGNVGSAQSAAPVMIPLLH